MALVVAGWSLASWGYGAYVLRSPLSVVRGFVDIVASGEVWTHTGASLSRIFVGFGGAVAGGCLMGLAAFLSRLPRGVVHHAPAVPNSTSGFLRVVVSILLVGLSDWAPIFTTFIN